MRNASRRRNRAAFTLMEVLLVLIILVVLGSLATGVFTGAKKKADINAARSQIGLFKTPLNMYQLDMGQYPTTLEELVVPPADAAAAGNWTDKYMENIPLDSWGNPYQYVTPGTRNVDSYDLWSFGPDMTDGTEDDIGNWVVQQ